MAYVKYVSVSAYEERGILFGVEDKGKMKKHEQRGMHRPVII